MFVTKRNLGNNASFDSLMETMRVLAEDVSDPPNQKAAFNFLTRCVPVWARPNPEPPAANGNSNHNPLNEMGLPGFERYIYERLVPTAFGVPSLPNLNLRDGQVTVVCLRQFYIYMLLCKKLIQPHRARSYTRLPTSYKPSPRLEDRKQRIICLMYTFLHKIGLKRQRSI